MDHHMVGAVGSTCLEGDYGQRCMGVAHMYK